MSANPTWISRKIEKIINAWTQHAPTVSFGGLTLAQFKNRVQGCTECRKDIESLEEQLKAAFTGRDQADASAREVIPLVVNSVKGSPDFGEDSVLYEAMGYTRKSQRRSGLTRRKRATPLAKSAA